MLICQVKELFLCISLLVVVPPCVKLYQHIQYLHNVQGLYVSYLFGVCFFFWHDSPQWTSASSFTRFLEHTQRSTAVGRCPLDKRSARSRDLYMTIHKKLTTDKHPCSRWDFFISTYSFGQTIIFLQHQSSLPNHKGLSSASSNSQR
jgi:hypothetical protein